MPRRLAPRCARRCVRGKPRDAVSQDVRAVPGCLRDQRPRSRGECRRRALRRRKFQVNRDVTIQTVNGPACAHFALAFVGSRQLEIIEPCGGADAVYRDSAILVVQHDRDCACRRCAGRDRRLGRRDATPTASAVRGRTLASPAISATITDATSGDRTLIATPTAIAIRMPSHLEPPSWIPSASSARNDAKAAPPATASDGDTTPPGAPDPTAAVVATSFPIRSATRYRRCPSSRWPEVPPSRCPR